MTVGLVGGLTLRTPEQGPGPELAVPGPGVAVREEEGGEAEAPTQAGVVADLGTEEGLARRGEERDPGRPQRSSRDSDFT